MTADANAARANTQRKQSRPRKYQWLGKSLADVEFTRPTRHDSDIRELGKRAFREGGLAKMRAVYKQLQRRGIYVGGRWDGIGGWYA